MMLVFLLLVQTGAIHGMAGMCVWGGGGGRVGVMGGGYVCVTSQVEAIPGRELYLQRNCMLPLFDDVISFFNFKNYL